MHGGNIRKFKEIARQNNGPAHYYFVYTLNVVLFSFFFFLLCFCEQSLAQYRELKRIDTSRLI